MVGKNEMEDNKEIEEVEVEDEVEEATDEYDDIEIKDFATSYNKVNNNKIDLVNLKYKSNIDHLSCPICQQPFIEPMTTTCGHTFCKLCIQECFKINNSTCPLDRTSLDETNINDLFPTPLIITNLIDELEVFCLNYKRGCTWTGCRWEIQHHVLEKCGYTGVECNGDRNGDKCKLLVERRFKRRVKEKDEVEQEEQELEEELHEEPEDDSEDDSDESNTSCLHLCYKCKYCDDKVTKITEKVHLTTTCQYNYKTCKLCFNDCIPEKNMDHHVKNCLTIGKLQCPARVIGCKWIGQNETNLEIHLENNCQLNSFLPYYNKMNTKINHLSTENEQLQKKINKILNLIIQGKILNLGYNDNLQDIDKLADDSDAENKLIYLNFEFDRLKHEINQKILPFLSNFNNYENLINNLVNDNHILKEDVNLQRMLIQSLRKQLQFLLFKNSPDDRMDLSRNNSEERLNLKL